MNLKRIDIIALNGGDGIHYKYEEVAKTILTAIFGEKHTPWYAEEKKDIINILVEAFPNEL